LVEFQRGEILNEEPEKDSELRQGTIITFTPDVDLFGTYHFIPDYVRKMLRNYVFLNTGLTILFNGEKFHSQDGLLDLLNSYIDTPVIYPIIHLREGDFEFAFTHCEMYGEEYYSFVNGQNTTQGGTHQAAFREALVKTIREFYKKDFDTNDIRASLVAALSIKVQDPVFESQTKTKLGSQLIEPDGQSIRQYVTDIVKNHLDDYLHMNPETAESLLKKILQSEKERKEWAGIKKIAKESVKKVSLHNKKLRDCRIHYNTPDDRGN